jgi:hypothetical protein
MKKRTAGLEGIQGLYFDAWRTYAKVGFDLWRTAVEQFWKVYHPLPHRRCEDVHAHTHCEKEGAQLAHHYGRRCQDVNVEHI